EQARRCRAAWLRWWHRRLEARARQDFWPESFPLEVMSDDERGKSAIDVSGPLLGAGGMVYQHGIENRGTHWVIAVSVSPFGNTGIVVARRDLLAASGPGTRERSDALWDAF